MANVTCEYDGGGNGDDSDINNSLNAGAAGSNGEPGRRIRRSETLLRQAAECVSRGQTFQTVSDSFKIPISTIRYIYRSCIQCVKTHMFHFPIHL